jgi:hypothetical protein
VDITKQPDLVLGENGVAFVKGQTTATVNGVPTTVDEIISFNLGYVPPNLGPGVPPTPNWTYQAQPTSALTILAILSDDSLAVNNSQNGVTRLDASGNPTQATSSLGGLPQYSWTGDWYVQGSQGTSALTLPFDVDEAGVWATPSGNPSDNGAADALCECDLQSTSDQQAQAASREVGPRELAQAASVANCAICNLPPPSAPATSCAVFTAPGSTYLILVGDSGTDHNVKQGFNLAAQQNANELQAQGNNVIACRISTATDLNNALTKNGSIGGGVVYYGHSGPYLYSTNPDVILSILAIGNAVGGDSNLHYHNIGEVCPPPGCSGILNSNITFAINGCRAGKKVAGDPSDASGITQTPIAKILARQISIRVSGYLVGTYFSLHNAATASSSNYKGEPDPLPQSLPMYLIPEGAPGNKKAPTAFCAVGNCPN